MTDQNPNPPIYEGDTAFVRAACTRKQREAARIAEVLVNVAVLEKQQFVRDSLPGLIGELRAAQRKNNE